MHKYQVTYNPDGTIADCLQLPDEPQKKRVIFVRAASVHEAKRTAQDLYSLAQ